MGTFIGILMLVGALGTIALAVIAIIGAVTTIKMLFRK